MDDPLVWVDLEMTGLDPDRDVIVEVAVLVSDAALERLQEGPDLVVAAPAGALDAMADVVRDMHAKSGLTDAVRASTLSLRDAEQQVLEFVRRHVREARVAPLAGNSIGTDRAFLRKQMPTFEAYLHYRNVDVSTVKELARRWYPEAFAAAPKKGGAHRALADIHESIGELRHYRATIFRS
jgi:oligoribonuclease